VAMPTKKMFVDIGKLHAHFAAGNTA